MADAEAARPATSNEEQPEERTSGGLQWTDTNDADNPWVDPSPRSPRSLEVQK